MTCIVFLDKDGNALKQVALAICEGRLDLGGELRPQSETSQEQAAVIFYRLFLQTTPVALDLPEALPSMFQTTMPISPLITHPSSAIVSYIHR